MKGASNGQAEALVQRARHHLNLGPFFKWVCYMYAERKVMITIGVHLAWTAAVWIHFAHKRFLSLKQSISNDEPFCEAQRIIPAAIFGCKHAILLQMIVLPFTMSRTIIEELSESFLGKLVPFERAHFLHIFCGYFFVALVFFALFGLVGFYGFMCANGTQEYCQRFTSEIMLTGFIVAAFTALIGVTAYLRHKIKYEIFYAVHLSVFLLLYVDTAAHTLDAQWRGGRVREQAFKWLVVALIFYFSDRFSECFGKTYSMVTVGSFSLVDSTPRAKTKTVVLKLIRPPLFEFKPGQYVMLRLPQIDNTWHPFSMASGADENFLNFYIEVFDEASWTGKLWILLNDIQHLENARDILEIDMRGPYGTRLVNTEDYSHAIVIGTGTGIVPILTIFNQHVDKLKRLAPETHHMTMNERYARADLIDMVLQNRQRSHFERLCLWCCPFCVTPRRVHDNRAEIRKQLQRRDEQLIKTRDDEIAERTRELNAARSRMDLDNGRALERYPSATDMGDNGTPARDQVDRRSKDVAASEHERRSTQRSKGAIDRILENKTFLKAKLPVFGGVLMSIFPIVGNFVIGLLVTNCWDPFPYYLASALEMVMAIFLVAFALAAFFVWPAQTFVSFVDVFVSLILLFLIGSWKQEYKRTGDMSGKLLFHLCLPFGYMILRTWYKAVLGPRYKSWKKRLHPDGISTLDCLELVWVTRSAALVPEVLPIINTRWEQLVEEWGEENARKVCKVSIHITGYSNSDLRSEFAGTGLWSAGAIQAGRPDFPAILERHMLDLFCQREVSHTVLAFCGSPQRGRELQRLKIENDMIKAITGYTRHQTDFVMEAFGGENSPKRSDRPRQTPVKSAPVNEVSPLVAIARSSVQAPASKPYKATA